MRTEYRRSVVKARSHTQILKAWERIQVVEQITDQNSIRLCKSVKADYFEAKQSKPSTEKIYYFQ